MRIPLNMIAFAALAMSASAGAQSESPADADLVAGGQYTAELNQSNHRWQLLPADGRDVEINAESCPVGAPVPNGLWLLVTGADGRPELLAPSTTVLPAGASEHVALRACDDAASDGISLPQSVIDLLTASSGAVYIHD
ncbi:hypothetical protein [Arenimonas oryziterrae]|uniref:Uncharacterized protein n=1 Tax=Arenimonas oryziterrae DSM 21050 = YC6267 TaxID=1121015 RepID=A0A091AT57_9GAMM|nr:hypothetical protein [Arenimonas oryziterrae]KFN42516.1 hypothetical protein N789_12820 [Arenimonas oryziterrae DSM 21050 = YC6267]